MKRLLFVLTMFAALTASAQTEEQPVQAQAEKALFGYLSYDSAMHAMPDYALVLAQMAELREKYEAEQQRVADDFNKKYEEFLDGLSSFPQTILQKRQSELQEMLDKNIAFKKEGQRLLGMAEEEALAPLRQRLADVLATLGQQRGYAFILNTDLNAVPYINPTQGEDINEVVKELLK